MSPGSWLPRSLGNTWPRENVLATPPCLSGTSFSGLKQNDVHGGSLSGHFLLAGRRSAPGSEAIGSREGAFQGQVPQGRTGPKKHWQWWGGNNPFLQRVKNESLKKKSVDLVFGLEKLGLKCWLYAFSG